jgi:hypothetical protein
VVLFAPRWRAPTILVKVLAAWRRAGLAQFGSVALVFFRAVLEFVGRYDHGLS